MAVETHRKQYVYIFIALAVLTALEVGIVQLLDAIGKNLVVIGLIGMAIGKAGLVANYYMHLGHEYPLLRRIIYFCLAVPAIYAIVLIAEATWRMLA